MGTPETGPSSDTQPTHALCVDFGSTFTKMALVDLAGGTLCGAVAHRTTLETDVMDGYDACLAVLVETYPEAIEAEVLACSSAGGGLRIAVVGNEELVTAEAGRRVALSSGGKVVAVLSNADGADEFDQLVQGVRPDVVLLTGGTDGGDDEGLLAGAAALVHAGWRGPVVVAGNVAAHDQVTKVLMDCPVVLADNVVPRIGVLAPESARAAIREMFLSHVIGGKGLSRREQFTSMVRGATPDLVLTGVEVLADHLAMDGSGDVVVVDIGGATTDVHSVVTVDPEEDQLSRSVVADTRVTRTVEGDLGMRWSAASTVQAGVEAGLLEDAVADAMHAAGVRRSAAPDLLPTIPDEQAEDELIATIAATVALRRHVGRSKVVLGPDGRVVERTGKDLREVDLLIGSGGVLRSSPELASRVLAKLVGPSSEGWQQPEHPQIVVDQDYVLAAVGLLVERHREAAARLARSLAECAPHPAS